MECISGYGTACGVFSRAEILNVPTTELWSNMTVVFTITFGW